MWWFSLLYCACLDGAQGLWKATYLLFFYLWHHGSKSDIQKQDIEKRVDVVETVWSTHLCIYVCNFVVDDLIFQNFLWYNSQHAMPKVYCAIQMKHGTHGYWLCTLVNKLNVLVRDWFEEDRISKYTDI